MRIETFPDFAGDGIVHTIAAIGPLCTPAVTLPERFQTKWFQVTVVSGSGTARIGGSNISTTRGLPFGSSISVGQLLPQISDLTAVYDLATTYLLIPIGMTVAISWV